MRLNAFLARAGVASRRRADELIKAGRVTVNGEPGQLNTVVGARDRVEVDGQTVERQRLRYVLLHKPTGRRDHGSRPAGAADRRRARARTSRGSSLWDGSTRTRPERSCSRTTGSSPTGSRIRATASRRRTSPRSRAIPDEDALRRLRDGVELDDGRTAPARARRLGRGRVELVLHEGRKHQVKRMLAAVGHPVTRLHRQRLRGADARRARARRVPGARALRGRAATSRLVRRLAAEACSRARDSAAPGRDATPGCARRR